MGEVSKSIPIVFEMFWQSSEGITDWKKDSVILIYKKGKKEDLGDYRPVSLTLVECKMMEKILLRHMERQAGDGWQEAWHH